AVPRRPGDRDSGIHRPTLAGGPGFTVRGKSPWGAPPFPPERPSGPSRPRRVVAAAEQAARAQTEAADGPPGAAFKHRKPKNLPSVVVNTTDPDSRIMPTRRGLFRATTRRSRSAPTR